MTKKYYLFLWILGGGLALAGAIFQSVPGYMDAEYYYAGGLRLAAGQGFSDPFIWNYLNDPVGIPTPSFIYWMPLPSILAAVGMKLLMSEQYLAARLLFLLLASCIPPFTAWLSVRLMGKEQSALLSGVLSAFSGYYLVYIGLVEVFALMMILGGLFIYISSLVLSLRFTSKQAVFRVLLLGFLAGFIHMTRADGILWLAAAVLIGIWVNGRTSPGKTKVKIFRCVIYTIACITGYVLITWPWYARNLELFGGLFPPGNSRGLWLVDYDQMFNYPATALTMENWLNSGVNGIIIPRLSAMLSNLGTSLAVQGEIILFPLILLGVWRLRRDIFTQLTAGIWVMIFIAMTFIFPFAGARGGYLHSGAGVQVMLWIMVPEGLGAVIAWGKQKRNWKPKSSTRVFSIMLVGLAAVFSLFVFMTRVIQPTEGSWDVSYRTYLKVDTILDELVNDQERTVMVNNPPGYYLASGDQALVIPNGNLDTIVNVAEFYQADIVVLENATVKGMQEYYLNPRDIEGLKLLYSQDGIVIYRVMR